MRKGFSTFTHLFLLVTLGLGAAFYTGALQVPHVSMTDIGTWGNITEDHVEIVTTINVDNPNEFDINLQPIGVTYHIYMNNVLLAQGVQQGERIPPGYSTVDIRTALIQRNITDWWVTHLQNNEETEVRAEAAVEIDTPQFRHEFDGIQYTHDIDTDIEPMLGEALAGLEGSYEYPATGISLIDPEIDIRDTDAVWGQITDDYTELQLTLNVYNPNAYPLPAPEFVGQLVMNDVTVANWSADDVHMVEEPGDGIISSRTAENITLGINLHHDAITDWLTRHIKQNEFTEGHIQARIGFTIQGETLYIPPQGGLHCEFQFWTAILEDQVERMEDQGCSIRDLADDEMDGTETSHGNIMDTIGEILG